LRISAKVIFWGRSDIAHNLADRGEGEAARGLQLLVFAAHQLAGLPIDKVDLRTSWAIELFVFVLKSLRLPRDQC
jgi:hypothetical protein